MQAQGGGCAFTLDGTSSSGFRGHSLLLPVGLTALFPEGGENGHPARTVLRWPGAWQLGPEAN